MLMWSQGTAQPVVCAHALTPLRPPYAIGSVRSSWLPHYCERHGERSLQLLSAAVAHSVVLSVWQRLQAFGIFSSFVCAGQMKRKVWLRTFTSPSVSAIFGMWQAMHSLPGLPAA